MNLTHTLVTLPEVLFLRTSLQGVRTRDPNSNPKLKNKKLFKENVTRYAVEIAKSKKIRKLLGKYQKKFSKQNHVCIEGRDIGSVICPNADVKIFFKCNLKVRAKRRWKEYKKNNLTITL